MAWDVRVQRLGVWPWHGLICADTAREGAARSEAPGRVLVLTAPPQRSLPPATPRAEQTIIEAARMKEEGRVKKVVVTGCLAQRYSEELAEQLPEADLVIG